MSFFDKKKEIEINSSKIKVNIIKILKNENYIENFEIIKSRVDRINIITNEAQKWIDTMPDNFIDCFALSNICELMSEQETQTFFTAIKRTAKNNARIIFRNLMIPREVPGDLHKSIEKDLSLSKELYETDRSFVYGKVAAYTVHKKN